MIDEFMPHVDFISVAVMTLPNIYWRLIVIIIWLVTAIIIYPVVLRSLQKVVAVQNMSGMRSICGEMAADPPFSDFVSSNGL